MVCTVAGCSGKQQEPEPAGTVQDHAQSATVPAAAPAGADEPLPPLPYKSTLPAFVRDELGVPFKGDLDEMVQRRLVRIGVTFNRTHYFVDQGVQRGVAYEYGRLMRTSYKRRKTGNLRVVFWFVPLPRDQLLRRSSMARSTW